MADNKEQYDVDLLVGYDGLAIGIIKYAIHDLIKYKDKKDNINYITAKDFLLSGWCVALSGIDTDVLRDNIKKYYEVDIYENN